MAEKLTNEQQAAVDSRERSLLVSAAAGSGKTKVLVERLFSYVEREGANLDDFLIITYTRAAASELRGKIAKALTERMERDPGNYHLRQQMLRVYRADIKTVDAFCTALLRENCHLCIFLSSRRSCTRSLASRLESGSSRQMIAGSVTSARAMATRCCWPPESCVVSF